MIVLSLIYFFKIFEKIIINKKTIDFFIKKDFIEIIKKSKKTTINNDLYSFSRIFSIVLFEIIESGQNDFLLSIYKEIMNKASSRDRGFTFSVIRPAIEEINKKTKKKIKLDTKVILNQIII